MDEKQHWAARASRSDRLTLAGLALAVLLGIFFRTIWGDDIEYKGDEKFSFDQSQSMLRGAPLPATGMPTSMGPPNTGFSVQIFGGLAWLMNAATPPELARGVQLLNVAAILLLLVFVGMGVPPAEREAWFWAVALVSASPMAVMFHRKIWPPSPTPIFTVAMIAGWWCRERRWGSFLWGAAGSLIGQLEIPSSFLSLGFALWALLFDRRSTRWRWWLLGSLLASLWALPWALSLLRWSGDHSLRLHWHQIGNLSYWWGAFYAQWLKDAFGFGIASYILEGGSADFMRWPVFGGWPTHGVLVLQFVLGFVASAAGIGLVRHVWRERPALSAILVGRESATDFTLSAAFLGYGLLLVAAGVYPIYRHYLIALFFLEQLWVARLLLRVFADRLRLARALLVVLWLCQTLVSFAFLSYVHERQFVGGDYGTTWKAQQPAPAP